MHDMSPYSMLIDWSDEDSASLVTLPEWASRVNAPSTHGGAYEEAARNGAEVLELLIEVTRARGESLPEPVVVAISPH